MRVILNEEDILFPFSSFLFLEEKDKRLFRNFRHKTRRPKRPGQGIVAEREI